MLIALLIAMWQPPTQDETLLMGVAIGMDVVDVTQTIHNLKLGAEEINPILGRHPSTTKLIVYNQLALGGLVSLWFLLPPKFRWLVPIGLMLVESFVIEQNFQVMSRF